MNADRMATTAAKNFAKNKGNGTIMVNLQKSHIDSECTIRIWSKIDDAFKILAKKLELDMTKLKSPPKFKNDVFLIPYDENGKYLGKDTKKLMKLDFNQGSKIKIVHPDSSCFGVIAEVKYKHDDHYSVKMKSEKKEKPSLYALGNWMIDQAIRGAIEQFSYANEYPEFVSVESLKKEINQPKEIKNEEKIMRIGNTSEKIDTDQYKWKIYVKSNQDDIDQVKFILHSTFTPNEIIIKKSPFQIERTGWGTFPIKMNILFKDGVEAQVEHTLAFSEKPVENIVKIY